MSRPADVFRAETAAALARAELANLPNVKAREMAAFEAWSQLAERAELSDVVRKQRSGQ